MLYLLIILVFLMGIIFFLLIKRINEKENENEKLLGEIEKINRNNVILKDWLIIKQNHNDLEDWLIRNKINSVAIYGYGILGKVLITELYDGKVNVECIVDKNYKNICSKIPAVGIDQIPNVDAIIVSVVNYYDELETELLSKCKCAIISLEDLVYGTGYKFEK